jgi:subtilisin family serine protease
VGDNGDGGIGMRQSRSSRISSTAGAALIVLVVGSWLPAGANSEDTEAVIVVLHEDAPWATAASVAADEVIDTVQGEVLHVYSHALHGFAAEVPTDELDALAQHPSVAAVIPDLPVHASVIDPAELTSGIDRIEADRSESISPVNVDIAIIDSGISFPHPDLNVVNAVDCLSDVVCDPEGDVQDANGHGTHVAGIAAARIDGAGITGVAPGARLWSVRVLDANGEGSLADVISGIDSVTANSASIEVANMSLGFVFGPGDLVFINMLNQFIAESVTEGVVFAVAAGNDSIPASQSWPAVSPDVITVSAISDGDGRPGGVNDPQCRFDQDDTLADFSNFGPAVAMAAPGVCIISTWLDGTYEISSGTSMASPFVAGAAARYIAESGMNPSSAVGAAQVRAAIVGAGVSGACGFTDEVDGVAEPLLFMNGPLFGGDGSCDPVPSPNIAPVANAGADQVVNGLSTTLPGLGGATTDANANLATVAWTAIGGPGNATFSNASVLSGSVSVTVPGLYSFRLTVRDSLHYSDFDDVQVNFNPASPPPPPPPPPPPLSPADGVGVVDQGSGLWTLRRPDGSTFSFFFGNPGDVPFMGDWNCDGIDTPGLYRQSDGFVYLRNTNTQGIADIRFFFGNPGDLPLAGDFDGDGCDTVSIYRSSEARWYVINQLGANDGGLGPADFSYLFGDQADVHFVGDWNSDGLDTPGLRRFSNGFVYIRNTNSQGYADQSWFYGDNGDHVFTGDFNGDGTDSIGLFRPANTTIYLRNSLSTGIADAQFQLGTPNSKPVAGKFN